MVLGSVGPRPAERRAAFRAGGSRLLRLVTREIDLAIVLGLGSAGGTSFRPSTPLKHGVRFAASLRSVFPARAPQSPWSRSGYCS
jgi:hypothetical protein